MNKGSIRARLLVGLGAVAIVAAACSSSGASTAPSAAASGGASVGNITVGISNPGAVGNGWREAMICSAKAQAVKPGNVTERHASIIREDRRGRPARPDIRDLIAKGVNVLSDQPGRPGRAQPGHQGSHRRRHRRRRDRRPVTAPGAYNLSNDQEQYAYLGAKWLFEQLGGKGAVVYMRGIAGHPADTDRDKGFKKAMAEYPGITIAKETVDQLGPEDRHRPDQRDPVAAAPSSTASGPPASTTSSSTRSRRPSTLVPIVGADNAGFVKQLLNDPRASRARP